MAQIEKLNGENYVVWSVQMKSLLVTLDLWDAIKGDNGISPTVDQKALANITLCVKPSEILHIKNCATAKEAWDTFSRLYQRNAPSRKVNLFKKLVRFRFQNAEKYAPQLNEFYTMVDDLKAISVVMPEDFLSILLLSSLPEEMENFVVAIESRDELPGIEVLKSKILEEEERQKSKGEKMVAENVFVAKFRQQKTGKDDPKQCKSRTQGNNDVKCYKCGKKGHVRAQCKSKCDSDPNGKAMSAITDGEKNDSEIWILDSGASSHMCRDLSYFIHLERKSQNIMLASGDQITAEGVGTVEMKSNVCDVTFKNVWYVPNLHSNFLSVSKIIKAGFVIEFKAKKGCVKTKQNEPVFTANLVGDIFHANLKRNSNVEKVNRISVTSEENLKSWHARFGHLNVKDLCSLSKKNMVRGLEVKMPEKFECFTCAVCKISRRPFPKNTNVNTTDVLQLVHTDLCGPMRISSLGGSKYIMTIIDDYSRYMTVYFLKNKSEALEKFKEFKMEAEKQTGQKVKSMRSDNGKEYVNSAFSQFLVENGIVHQKSCPYTPQQNGVAERVNRTLTEMARCMLDQSKSKQYLWAEAVNTATYIRNRSPTKVLDGKTPYELWVGRKPSVSHFKIFGCEAVVMQHKQKRSKFEPKGVKMIFVGYEKYTKGYRLFNPTTQNIVIARDVIFFENTFATPVLEENLEVDSFHDFEIPGGTVQEDTAPVNIETVQDKTQEHNQEIAEDDDESQGSAIDVPNANGKRCRGRPKICRTGRVGRPRKVYVTEPRVEMLNAVIENPTTIADALNSDNAGQWKHAMQVEYDSLIKNKTWELVDPPKSKNVISCKWVFVVKRKPDGSVEKFKARLVARGCSQKYNIDYKETYAPVVRHSTIRLVLALAAKYELMVNHVDIVSAYLNGDLQEEVYMKQPPQFENENFPNKVCKLKRSLYGLRQSGREWNKKVTEILTKIGFTRCKTDNCVYVRRSNETISLIAIYVDDLLLACTSEAEMQDVITSLNKKIEAVDRGAILFYLGMEIEREDDGNISIHQSRYVQQLLEEWNMENCKSVSTPLANGIVLKKCDQENCGDLCDVKTYQSLIGGLMYLSVISRPDISHAVSRLSQFASHPHNDHFAAAKHILRYLKGHPQGKITYSSENGLCCFTDSDWGADSNDRKSYSGCALFFGDGLIAWESKKQHVVSLSSMEAEYIALCQGAKEVAFQRSLLQEMGFSEFVSGPTTMYCDNQGAEFLVKNPTVHKRSKHIDIRYHYIREKYMDKEVDIEYVPSTENAADILTKALSRDKHFNCCNILNLTF